MSAGSFTADDFCVVAAVNDSLILAECLARSPDIASGRLPLVTVMDATSIPEAYNRGLARARGRICVFAHQDVYLPNGWLIRAIETLNRLSAEHPEWMVAGCYGLMDDGVHVGRLWDVAMGRELGSENFTAQPVASLDEVLLVLRRDVPMAFDEDLAHFHFYGTDIVQAARATGASAWAVEIPVVHNNRPIVSLRGDYERAYFFMRRKWKQRLPIPTTVATLSRVPWTLWRAQWRRRKLGANRGGLLADAVEIARAAGYE